MIEVSSSAKDRYGWVANIEIVSGRAHGDLIKPDGSVCRKAFNVKINRNGGFAVDIGTGSGVKIPFRIEDYESL